MPPRCTKTAQSRAHCPRLKQSLISTPGRSAGALHQSPRFAGRDAGRNARRQLLFLNWENLRRLEELAAYCAENGIELTFVLPPIDDALRQYLVAPLGLDEPMRTIRQALADTGAAVRDFEVEPEAVYAEEQYYDGFHLDVERGLPEFTRALFGAKEA